MAFIKTGGKKTIIIDHSSSIVLKATPEFRSVYYARSTFQFSFFFKHEVIPRLRGGQKFCIGFQQAAAGGRKSESSWIMNLHALVFTIKHDYTYRSLRTWSFNRWRGLWFLGEWRKSRPFCGSWRSWWSPGGRAENLEHARTCYGTCTTHSGPLHAARITAPWSPLFSYYSTSHRLSLVWYHNNPPTITFISVFVLKLQLQILKTSP